ncbi:tellurium resistance protein TerC [Actinomycetota bacterium]|nr:tellurium resistance protein TerC [Actinomycetota bacterium]
METSVLFEVVSLLVLLIILFVDVIHSFVKPEPPKNKTAIIHVVFYIVLAAIFGGIIWFTYGYAPATEFYSGYLTEFSLSIDNLFVFVLIINNFKVPQTLQKQALGVGIIIALVLRAIFIWIGGAVIEQFGWVFYIFGAFLIYTAINLLVSQESSDEYHENMLVRFFHKVLPMTDQYEGNKVIHKSVDKSGNKAAKVVFTPLLIVFVSLGVTDLFFAFDSIPAIFGLTKDPFIVLVANIFALMGLQQLYFLLGNMVNRLKFLPLGLAIVLAFIGVKLIFEAMHSSVEDFGWTGLEWVPEIDTLTSLLVIVITIGFTATASVIKIRRDDRYAAMKAQIKAEIKAEFADAGGLGVVDTKSGTDWDYAENEVKEEK